MKREIDLANLAPLTAAQQAELAALAVLPDSQIDHSDIPSLTDEFWKQATTVRVDADVLMLLKGQGKGYQTRINAILREAMLRSFHPKG